MTEKDLFIQMYAAQYMASWSAIGDRDIHISNKHTLLHQPVERAYQLAEEAYLQSCKTFPNKFPQQ